MAPTLTFSLLCVVLLLTTVSPKPARAAPNASTPPATPAIEIPRLANVTIDGNLSDWGDKGYRIEAMPLQGGLAPASAADFTPTMRLAWDDRGLLVLIHVAQTGGSEDSDVNSLWRRDSVELFVASDVGAPDLWQAVVAPGLPGNGSHVRGQTYEFRQDPKLLATPLTAEYASSQVDGGYVIEVRMPWSNLGITPQMGRTIGFQAYIHKVDSSRNYSASLYRPVGAPWNHSLLARLQLSDSPSQPMLAAAMGNDNGTASTDLTVLAAPSVAGAQMEVRDRGRLLGSATVKADGPRGIATVSLPFPAYGKTFTSLDVTLAGKPLGSVSFADATQLRITTATNADYKFEQNVFASNTFPDSALVDPGLVETALGKYQISRTFYDDHERPVDAAYGVGRYTAVIEITDGHGNRIEHHQVLYRTRMPLAGGSVADAVASLQLSADIDPSVINNQDAIVGQLTNRMLDAGGAADEQSAILLGTLHELSPADPALSRIDDPQMHSYAWWYRLEHSLGRGELQAIVTLPHDYDKDRSEKWPVIVVLHGSLNGQTPSFSLIANDGTVSYANSHPDFGFIIVRPLLTAFPRWVPEQVKGLIESIEQKYRVDPDRICLTGYSLGGLGTWTTAMKYPNLFAAISPISGFADVNMAYQVKGIDTWIVHGGKDTVVNPLSSLDMYNALVAAGGHARYTVYTDWPHGPWGVMYNRPDWYAWLAEQRRGVADMPCSTDAIAGTDQLR